MEQALKLFRVHAAVVCVLAGLTSISAVAQSDFPAKSIRMVVGFTAGGISDVLARALGARLSAQVGQQVVVDNRAGAGTTIAAELVAKAPPDGYTLFMQDMTTQAINASLYKKLPYDTVKDFTPITLVAASPLMLVVHPSLPVKSVKELIALGKAKPGQIPFASSGNGTILHLAAETFKTMGGIDLIHVPYKGSAQAVQALLAGEVAVTFSTMPPALANVKAGRLRALGVTTPKRNAAAPEVPTVAESGLKGFDVVLYSGVLGPAGCRRRQTQRRIHQGGQRGRGEDGLRKPRRRCDYRYARRVRRAHRRRHRQTRQGGQGVGRARRLRIARHVIESTAAPRALRLLADHRAQGLPLARWQAPRILSDDQYRMFRVRQGARPRQRQARRAADPSQLFVARLRQPRRHLALFRYVRRNEIARRAQHQ